MKNKITFESLQTLQHIIYPKWSPIIESIFNVKNQSVKRHLCNYCEWFSQSYDSEIEYDNQLSLKLKDINIILDNFEKVDIVGKVYNQVTGIIEYKLSNGKYAPITGI